MDFQYVAFDQDRHVVRGTQTAASPEVAAKMLAGRGYKVLTVNPVPSFLPRREQLFSSSSKVKQEIVVDFLRQLALLLDSGTDVMSALELLRTQATGSAFKSVLANMIADLRRGDRLSIAMSRHPKVFPKMYVHTIGVGEQVGGIESVLRQVADYIEKDVKTSRNLKGALQYPAIVTVVALIVIGVLAVYVFPVFVDLYTSLGAELPALTKVTLALMSWTSDYGLFAVLALAAIAFVAYFYGKTPQGKEQIDALVLKMPLFGRIIHLNELVRCCRGMALLHKAGVPIPEIIGMIVETSNNGVLKKGMAQLHQNVLRGQSMSGSMASNFLFLPMMVQMIRVGEKTGTLDATLMATANAYESEAENRTKNVVGLIQPVVTVVLGLVVAVIALSLVTAMYSIYGQNV